jgi:hypothetical protein
MRTVRIDQFVKLRQQLSAERETLQARLRDINEAFGEMPLPSLAPIEGASGVTADGSRQGRRGRRRMSPEARARIAAAQRARWAKLRRGNATAPKSASNGTAGQPRRKMSAAGRRAIAEAARRRWAAAKAAGKSRL